MSDPSEPVAVRRLTPDDWALTRQLRLAALRDAPAAFLTQYEQVKDRPEEFWRTWPVGAGFAALRQAEPVGLVCAWQPDEHPGVTDLYSMWVAPQARGRGVAGQLIDAVVRYARDQGSRFVRLEVAAGNDVAYRAYLRNAFVPTDEPPRSECGQVMRLELRTQAAAGG